MKTIFKICLIASLIGVGLGDACAQSAASSKETVQLKNSVEEAQIVNKDTIIQMPGKFFAIPNVVENLLAKNKVDESLAEFEKFKAAQQKNKMSPYSPFALKVCEVLLYDRICKINKTYNRQYSSQREALLQDLIKNYPKESDLYILQIDLLPPDADKNNIVELATRAIELDETNYEAYRRRASALYSLGKTKEACQSLEPMPKEHKDLVPLSAVCNSLPEEEMEE